jgi:hypothetical protein
MEIYTTAFSYPRRLRHARNPSPPLDFPSHSQPDPYQPTQFQQPHHNGHTESHVAPTAPDPEAVQKLAVLAMSTQGCHVSFSIADHGTGWNFLISGAYQQVLFARGMIIKDCPIQVCSPLFTELSGSPHCGHFFVEQSLDQSPPLRSTRFPIVEAHLEAGSSPLFG